MDKFLITRKTANKVTGPIMVTTSARASCPLSCAFRKGAPGELAGLCYAEHGALGGFLWTSLDRGHPGETVLNGVRIYDFAELLTAIRQQDPGALWRHNIAGDLPSTNRSTLDATGLRAIIEANRGRRGFTFTHFDVLTNFVNRQLIKEANDNGFTINLSGNSPAHADQLADLRVAPVTTVLAPGIRRNLKTPKGRTIVICPTNTHGLTCAECGLCARASRSTIIGFPASGGLKFKVRKETGNDGTDPEHDLRAAPVPAS